SSQPTRHAAIFHSFAFTAISCPPANAGSSRARRRKFTASACRQPRPCSAVILGLVPRTCNHSINQYVSDAGTGPSMTKGGASDLPPASRARIFPTCDTVSCWAGENSLLKETSYIPVLAGDLARRGGGAGRGIFAMVA